MAWCSEWKCRVFCFLFSMCYSVLFFGIVVTEGFHFMPNDWTFTLLFHFHSGCVWRKMHHLFFPWSFLHLVSNLALAWHFSFLSNAAGFVSFFSFFFLSQTLTSPLWVKNRRSYEGFEDIPAVWLQEAAFMKNKFVADWGEVYLWFLFSKHVHRSKLMQQVVIFDDLKKKREKTTTKQLFSNRAVSTMQEWAIHPHRPTIPKCLSDDSSNHVNSILWFLYRSSSRTSSTVCLWCIFAFLLWFFLLLLFFVFLEWYWWAVHFPGLLAPEGSKLQISVVSGQFHLKSVGVDEA